MNFRKSLASMLIITFLIGVGEGVVLAKTKKNQKSIETRIDQVEDGIKIKGGSENLSFREKRKQQKLKEKIEVVRKKEASKKEQDLVREQRAQKRSIQQKIKSLKKDEPLDIIEKQALRKELKQQRNLLRDINEQKKLDLQTGLNRSLMVSEKASLEVVEPELFFESQVLSTDPEYPHQWGVQSVNVDGWNGTDNGTGNKVVVAVIDAGVDFNHPDLVNQKWVDPHCVDDQNQSIAGGCMNGGYDFVDNDDNPFPTDSVSHGTQVAAVVGAENNFLGMASIGGDDIEIMSVRSCCTAQGYFTSSALAKAVRFSVYNGAAVINMSLGGPTYSQELYDALELARDNDVLVVAAAGNYGNNNDTVAMYPANYDLENIVTVAATNEWDQLAYFSNSGQSSVDIAAPGQNVWTTNLNHTYQSISGTSFAAPMVASFLAKVRRDNPDDYTSVKANVLAAVEHFPLLNGDVISGRGFRFPTVDDGTTDEETQEGSQDSSTNEQEGDYTADEEDVSSETSEEEEDLTEEEDDYSVNDGADDGTTTVDSSHTESTQDSPIIPLSGSVSGNLIFHLEDHLTGGGVDTDDAGNIVSVLDYFPYGDVRLEENSSGYENDYKFTGKEKDEDTGLYYYEARYYDSSIGRFVGKDPWQGDFTDPQSLNKYSYVRNNPLKYVDPTGEFFHIAIGGAVGAIIGVVVQGLSDSIAGEYSGLAAYTGAAAGGLAAGGIIAGTGGLAAGSFLGATGVGLGSGIAGGAVGNLTEQSLNGKDFDSDQLVSKTAEGGLLGLIPGVGKLGIKVPKISAGRGSFEAIKKQINTKLDKGIGDIKNIGLDTFGKIIGATAVDESASSVVEIIFDQGSRDIDGINNSDDNDEDSSSDN